MKYSEFMNALDVLGYAKYLREPYNFTIPNVMKEVTRDYFLNQSYFERREEALRVVRLAYMSFDICGWFEFDEETEND